MVSLTDSDSVRTESISTDSFSASEQYDSWVEALTQTYGSWDVPPHKPNGFFATVRASRFDDVTIAEAVCDPCSGRRNVRLRHLDNCEQVVVQLIRSGHENFRLRDDDYSLGPGDILVWDSTKDMCFDVRERLHKVSLILPLSRLQDWLPATWHNTAGKIEARSPNAILLTALIESVTDRSLPASDIRGEHLSEAAVALLSGSVGNLDEERHASSRLSKLKSVQRYIQKNLGDTRLTLTHIAAQNGISKRYLHWLFQSTGETAARYVQRLRLERCRIDIGNPLMRNKTIADIAFSWGFSDPMHFSRVFKNHFGIRPSDLRKQRRQS